MNLAPDASLDSVLKLAVLDINTLREEEKQGLNVVMCVQGVAAEAILYSSITKFCQSSAKIDKDFICVINTETE